MEFLLPLMSAIAFPGFDPVIVEIGPLAIRWYGLAYVVGILLGWLYARALVARNSLWSGGRAAMSQADLDDFLLWAALGIVAGGRIGYILFYDLSGVVANPLRLFQIWNGGMSFHGGLIGTTLAMVLFARVRAINVWSLFDVVAAAAPIGLFFGRIANFINGELWGRATSVPWAVIFPAGGPSGRHPSQLYEAVLEGLLLFTVLAILIFRARMLTRPGFVAGAFVAGYALARILVEFVREPDPHIGYLADGFVTMGMVLSLPMLAIGLWAMLAARPADTGADHDPSRSVS